MNPDPLVGAASAGPLPGDRIGEVQEAHIAAHVGEPLPAARRHHLQVAVSAPQRAHERANAHAAQLVDGDTRLNNGPGDREIKNFLNLLHRLGLHSLYGILCSIG